MPTSTRVLLCTDHAPLREALRSFLSGETDIEVVGEASTGEETLERVAALRPDVVVLDISLPGANGLETARRIRKQSPQYMVLVLTMYHPRYYCCTALKTGAVRCILKSHVDTELVPAIRVARGRASPGHRMLQTLQPGRPGEH
ncbi:MAG: response regulator transcription factor [Chloroflexi bacterium]|nr:response regulator transcription factor [Chloroflexota bacterium]